MSDLFKRLPKEMDHWKHVAEGSRFFGLPISEMNREELLGIVGQLVEDKNRTFKRHAEEREFLFAVGRRN